MKSLICYKLLTLVLLSAVKGVIIQSTELLILLHCNYVTLLVYICLLLSLSKHLHWQLMCGIYH